MQKTLKTKRVYDPPDAHDGVRILVDRLWPRGLTKDKAKIDLWLKDIAPSDDLRKKFHAHPEKWADFCRAYAMELDRPEAEEAVQTVLEQLNKHTVTLLYASRDETHNNAVALQEWLSRKHKKK
jgi:uncharacterized protein YeaO (DUF488 family)